MQLDFLSKLVASFLPGGRAQAEAPLAPEVKREMRTGPEEKSSAEQLLREARDWLGGAGAGALGARLSIRWNARMRSTAGTAYPGKSLITLNPRLRAFGEAEVERTLRHELAHLLAHFRAGRRRIAPHGLEWRKACADLGLVDEPRCHDLPLPRRQMARRFLYRCGACGLTLPRVRALRARTACLACCRRHNGGRYDERFRLARVAV